MTSFEFKLKIWTNHELTPSYKPPTPVPWLILIVTTPVGVVPSGPAKMAGRRIALRLIQILSLAVCYIFWLMLFTVLYLDLWDVMRVGLWVVRLRLTGGRLNGIIDEYISYKKIKSSFIDTHSYCIIKT
jgi:hypothetical protein